MAFHGFPCISLKVFLEVFCLSRFCLVFVAFVSSLLLLGTNVLLQRLYWGQVSQIPSEPSNISGDPSSLSVAKEMLRCSRYELLNVIHKLFISYYCKFFFFLRCFFLWFSVICVNIFVHVLAKNANTWRVRRQAPGSEGSAKASTVLCTRERTMPFLQIRELPGCLSSFISWNLLPRAARAIRLYKQPKAEPNLWPAFCPTELSKLKTLCFKLL